MRLKKIEHFGNDHKKDENTGWEWPIMLDIIIKRFKEELKFGLNYFSANSIFLN